MGFHIQHDESVTGGIQRIMSEQLRLAMDDLRLRQPDTHRAVHAFRKRCKSMRGLLRLIRDQLGETYHLENRRLRDLSRQLSFVRDAQALIEAVDRLQRVTTVDSCGTVSKVPRLQPDRNRASGSASDPSVVQRGAFPAILAHLRQVRDQAAGGEQRLIDRMESMTDVLEGILKRVSDWVIEDRGFETYGLGLRRNYRRARHAMESASAEPTPYHFHEWRKRVKYHWYHTVLLVPICPHLLESHRTLAESLGEQLGEYQDYSVLMRRLNETCNSRNVSEEMDALGELVDRRQAKLREAAFLLGAYMQAESPDRLSDRWAEYWKIWKEQGPNDASNGASGLAT